MRKIYVVTSGEYSSYGISAVFDNREQAEKLAGRGGHNTEIEEYDLNPEYVDYKAQGYSQYYLLMLADGTILRLWQGQDDLYTEPSYVSEYGSSARLISNSWLKFRGVSIPPTLSVKGIHLDVKMIAKSEEQIIKVANEKRIQLLAENRWKEGEVA